MKILKKSFSCIVIAALMILAVTGCSKKEEVKQKDADSRIINISSHEIYIDDDATDEQIEKLKQKINSFECVTDIEYIDKKQAYYNAAERLGESSISAVGYTETDHPFPRTLRIKVKSDGDIYKISDAANEFDFVVGTDLDN